MSLEIAHGEAILPSLGKIYSSLGLKDKKYIEVRAMRVKELDIFNSPAYLRQGTVIDKIIESCLIDKTIPVSELIASDKDAIMLSIRVLTYGKNYTQEDIKCPDCENKEKEYKFDLSQTDIKTLDIEPSEPGVNEFDFLLPVAQKNIKFKLLTADAERDLAKMMESRERKGLEPADVSLRMKTQIIQVDGARDQAHISKFIDEDMHPADILELQEYIFSITPSIAWELPFVCPKCKSRNNVPVVIVRSFFRHK